jgi:RNA ligase (TIGR02306 family)
MLNIATIETIHSFKPHPNADALELAMIRGFQVVVRKGEYSHGQQVVYVWPDTLAEIQPWNAFLSKDGKSPVRFKSIKLRGEFSTGLVLPVSVLYGHPEMIKTANQPEIDNGYSVADILGVRKYIKDDGGASAKNGAPAGEFPSEYVSKTDEVLAQSEPQTAEEFANEPVYVTLKIDGQSLTFVRYGDEVSVSSRNLKIADGDNKFWNTVRKYGLIEKTAGMNIAIQGEQYGPSIQKNPLAVPAISFAAFNIKDLDSGRYFSYDQMVEFCSKHEIPMVPVLSRGEPFSSFEAYQNFADALKYESNHPAEGIVVRPMSPKYSRVIGRALSVKFINRNYRD